MRVLLLSDIHANIVAFDAVLAHAREYDAVWCLGDVVGYGPAPNECVEKLRPLNPLCLAGNHDWGVLGKIKLAEFNDNAQRALIWTRANLKPENLAWLNQLTPNIILPEYELTLVHASPREPIWEYIDSLELAAANMEYFDTPQCLFGHTHVPLAFYQSPTEHRVIALRLPEHRSFELEAKMLVNPGSVGQPRDGDPRTAYAILDLDTRSLTHERVEYDIAATQAAMAQVGLPRRLIQRLAYGA